MPRAAVRIRQVITDVRCEPLQQITERDAINEGVIFVQDGGNDGPVWEITGYVDYQCKYGVNLFKTARDSYRTLWNMLNGENDFDRPQWVWVVKFDKFTHL